jgi:preprotein translocase subunit YajC
MGPVIVIIILALGVWLFLAVPWRRRQRSHVTMQDAIVVGDDIITAGGIHAVVLEADEQALRIEIAPGVVVTLDRRAVAAVGHDEPYDDDLPPDAEDGRPGADDVLPEEVPPTG